MRRTTKTKRATKRNLAIAGVTVLLLGGAGAAYAFWTAGGSGTGTATTGSNVEITANQTSPITNLHPGGTAQTLSGNFTNTNDGPTYVTSISVSVASVTPVGAGTCIASDYVIAGSPIAVGTDIPAGTNVGAWTGATINFVNKATNQDGCKGATVNLAYTIN